MITLVDGFPAKICIADAVEHLGRILLEAGAIDDAAHNASLMEMSQGAGLHGDPGVPTRLQFRGYETLAVTVTGRLA